MTPVARRALIGLLAAQLAAVVAVIGYAAQGPLHPDGGLRQLDLQSLDEAVDGIPATGRPQLVVAAGPQQDPTCRAGVEEALRRRAAGEGGLDAAFDLTLLVPSDVAAPGTTADPDGRLARALALPDAATTCRPGYAVVDPGGRVRYRTYDPGWARHSSEQGILLGAVR